MQECKIPCLNRESTKSEDPESESILPTFIYKSKNYGLQDTSGLEHFGMTYLASSKIQRQFLMITYIIKIKKFTMRAA